MNSRCRRLHKVSGYQTCFVELILKLGHFRHHLWAHEFVAKVLEGIGRLERRLSSKQLEHQNPQGPPIHVAVMPTGLPWMEKDVGVDFQSLRWCGLLGFEQNLDPQSVPRHRSWP